MNQLKRLMLLAAAAALSACGGGGSSTSGGTGALLQDPQSRSALAPAALQAVLDGQQPGLSAVLGAPTCTVTTYSIKYSTLGALGEATDATAALMVPSGPAAVCNGPHPVVIYAHGTEEKTSFDMADPAAHQESAEVAAVYAAQGYIVVAPNYAGYAGSSLRYHAYLNGSQQSIDVRDAYRAARVAFAKVSTSESGKLFLTGVSQGGYVAMATQRLMQLSADLTGVPVTAMAPISGPYAMSLLTDAVFGGSPNLGGPLFLPMVLNGYQKAYGDIYASPSDVYEAQYATGIETLVPGASSFTDLVVAGKLPQLALFAADSLPQNAGFEIFFNADHLVKTSFRNTILADITANPCAANPAGCSPSTGLRKAARRNDLRTYVPNVPSLLCGGHNDPISFWANAQATAGYFTANGMQSSRLTLLDIDSPVGSSDPYAAMKTGFQAALAATAPDDVLPAYHGFLVTPFCNLAARQFFERAGAH
ncbi:alpha/beta hydrolase family protein [Ramlibacter humi]|uniref:Peptidase S9 prolyl oligopeptidase catalytic domain-containing protein n=1 Tax=Ramlibacter humi TaxID=2530451 RepID=A0A4Z0BPH6_9BURK|nr:prolyl oligopeptidase family serine peptidase [Ramlibacter humi]TFZ00310.1 hypothetical protein EZ216_14525 [Ramlibacter humi]